MTNLADFIERFLLQKLAQEAAGQVLVRRNELADELSCAPSQISYVLSTRFTLDRGYVVESRRGAGGFIRIVRMAPEAMPFAAGQTGAPAAADGAEAAARAADKPAARPEPTVPDLIDRLALAQLITKREEAMLQQLFSVLAHFLDDEGQRAVFRQTLQTLSEQA